MDNNQFESLMPPEMAEKAAAAGVYKVNKSFFKTFNAGGDCRYANWHCIYLLYYGNQWYC